MILRNSVLLLGLALSMFLVTSSLAWSDSLSYRGKPVHPGCVRELTSSVADKYPINDAVDLESCMSSTKYSEELTKENGVFMYRWGHLFGEPDPDFGEEYFGYQPIGQTQNGIFVLRTYEGGGGSGIFESLYFFRLVDDKVMEDDGMRERKLLRYVGKVGLGDRVLVKTSIEGNKIHILPVGGGKATKVVDLSLF